jgi:alanine racemase
MKYRDTYVEINLDNLNKNIKYCYSKINKPMMAILKANAYGHGYEEIAYATKDNENIIMYGVATIKEAIDLRNIGINKDILVLGPIPLHDLKLAIDNDISLALYSLPYLDKINKLNTYNKPVKVHIAIDSGMNRIGIKSIDEYQQLLSKIEPNKIKVDGIFSHFATADTEDDLEYNKQLELFKTITKDTNYKYIHIDNSASLLYHNNDYGNMARLGIAMYGVEPNGEETNNLKQVMSFYTKVSMIKTVPKGEKVGYGMTYEATKDTLVATLPVGYADGLIRNNQGRMVYINGKEYPIIGRVCMDQCMIEVDDNVKLGDIVEIFGPHISLARMANELDTIPYEITCLISPRVERIYISNK